MRHIAIAGVFLLLAGGARAESVWHAVHTLMPGDIVRQDDVIARDQTDRILDAMPADSPIVGLEVKRRIYQDHDVGEHDVGPVTAVKASSNVTVMWKSGDLSLELQGRALDAGAVGDEIRVLNPMSSRTIRGVVVGEGMVEVKADQ